MLAEWAPALVVFGIPSRPRGPDRARVGPVRILTRPPIALALWLLTYFVWHLPWMYDTALRHPWTLLHLEHALYFAAGCLFWWPVAQDEPHALDDGARALYLFAAFLFASPLGLLLALVPSPVYDFYEEGGSLWGLSVLTDQQIAGVTMAAEQAIVFFVAFSYFLTPVPEGTGSRKLTVEFPLPCTSPVESGAGADSNRRPLGPRASALTRLSYTPSEPGVSRSLVDELAQLGDLLVP